MMKGKPETPQEMIDRANEAYEFDRGSGSNWFSRGFTDLISNSGEVLDYQHQRINAIPSPARRARRQLHRRTEGTPGYSYGVSRTGCPKHQAAKDSGDERPGSRDSGGGRGGGVDRQRRHGQPGCRRRAVGAARRGQQHGGQGVMQEGGYALEDIGIDALTTLAGAASAGLIKLPGIDSQLNKLVGIADPKNATLMQTMLKGGLSGHAQGRHRQHRRRPDERSELSGRLRRLPQRHGRPGRHRHGRRLPVGQRGGRDRSCDGQRPGGRKPYAWAAFKGGVSGAGRRRSAEHHQPRGVQRPSGRHRQAVADRRRAIGSDRRAGLGRRCSRRDQKTAKQSAQQPADQGRMKRPHRARSRPRPRHARCQKTAPQSDAADDVSDVKAKVEAEAQGGKQQVSPEQEAAKQKTVAEAEESRGDRPGAGRWQGQATPQAVEEQAAKKPLTAQEAFDLAEQANYQPRRQEPDPVKLKAAARAKAQLAERLPSYWRRRGDARLAHGDDAQALQTRRQSFETALALEPRGEARSNRRST